MPFRVPLKQQTLRDYTLTSTGAISFVLRMAENNMPNHHPSAELPTELLESAQTLLSRLRAKTADVDDIQRLIIHMLLQPIDAGSSESPAKLPCITLFMIYSSINRVGNLKGLEAIDSTLSSLKWPCRGAVFLAIVQEFQRLSGQTGKALSAEDQKRSVTYFDFKVQYDDN